MARAFSTLPSLARAAFQALYFAFCATIAFASAAFCVLQIFVGLLEVRQMLMPYAKPVRVRPR
jgi:hypothetical protein